MTTNSTNEIEKGRVLFTGRGDLMIDDLMQHMPKKYDLLKCAPVNDNFISAIEKFHPHVILVCLLDETRDMLRMYDVLDENTDFINIPVIVIGKEDDCVLFKQKVMVKNLEILPRPLDRERFLDKLDRNIEFSSEYMEKEKLEEANPTVKEVPSQSTNPSVADLDDETLLDKIEKGELLVDRKMVLVVDDDVRMLNMIKLYLQDYYDVTVVPSGKLALKFLSKKTADIVLLDYMMPDMDGPEVLREIRLNSNQPNLPVLFLTGVSDKEMVMKGLEYHPNGYLLKPATRTIILERVTEILLGL